MAEKKFVKGDRVKFAGTKKREVELKFAGYREVPAEEPVKEAPELTEAEMAQLPEAKDADVVDTTEADWEANGGAVKADETSNTAPGGPPRPRPQRNRAQN